MGLTTKEVDRIVLAVAPMLLDLNKTSAMTPKGYASLAIEGMDFLTPNERESFRDIVCMIAELATKDTQ